MDSRDSVDATDRQLLVILSRRGRITITDLAAEVHLSQAATAARVRRLEERGIIAGYGAQIDSSALGVTAPAVIRLRTTHAQLPRALEQFTALPEITRIRRVTGEDCFVLDVEARDTTRLEELVDEIGRFGPVSTSVVLREYTVSADGQLR